MMLMVRRPVQHLVDGGHLPGQLGDDQLAHPHRQQQVQAAHQRSQGGGEGGGVDAQGVARGQEDVVVAVLLGGQGDGAAVRPGRAQGLVGHAQALVVVVAQGGEPADLDRAGVAAIPLGSAAVVDGSREGHPSEATTIR